MGPRFCAFAERHTDFFSFFSLYLTGDDEFADNLNADNLRSGDSCAASAVLQSHGVSEHLHTNHQTVFTGADIKRNFTGQ